MTWPIQDHANAVLALLAASPGSPALAVYDTIVPNGATTPYVKADFYVTTPDATVAPDKTPFTYDSTVIDMWIYCHCVGSGDQAAAMARVVSGRVRAALLNVTPVIAGRTCFPVRFRESSPPQRDENTMTPVVDQVDVYGLTTVP